MVYTKFYGSPKYGLQFGDLITEWVYSSRGFPIFGLQRKGINKMSDAYAFGN